MEVMAGRFVNLILEKLCPHRFSWPHSGVHGQDYQVCLICGTAYEYDWVTMRRVRRLESPLNSLAGIEGQARPRDERQY